MKRITILLTDQDYQRLVELARAEYRDIRQQAGLLIRESLEARDEDQEEQHEQQQN